MVLPELRPMTSGPWRRISPMAAGIHAKLLALPPQPIGWAACAEDRNRSCWWVQLAVNDAPVRLHVHSRTFDQWATTVAGPNAPWALASAGIAHNGRVLWQALSTSLHAPVEFVEARAMHRLTVPDDALAWKLPSLGWHGVMYASSDSAWARLSEGLPSKASVNPSDGLMELPLQVCMRVGEVRLGSTEFARLRQHCVVLIDESIAVHRHRDLTRLGVTVLAGPNRRAVARAVWVGDALYRVADFVVINSDEPPSLPSGADMSTTEVQVDKHSPATTAAEAAEGDSSLSQPHAPTTSPSSATQHHAPDLSDVEVDVRFELGRMRWPLRQLVQWRVGQPVPLDLALRDAPVTAWVHDRCIASGRLVVIGERLGVRMDEVFDLKTKPSNSSNSSPVKA
jgi:flagellar motor switch/type III secretory pathway protein FliN